MHPELKAAIEANLEANQRVVVLLRKPLDQLKGRGSLLDKAEAIPYQHTMATLDARGAELLELDQDDDVEDIVPDSEESAL